MMSAFDTQGIPYGEAPEDDFSKYICCVTLCMIPAYGQVLILRVGLLSCLHLTGSFQGTVLG